MGTRDRPPRAAAALPLPARHLSASVRSRHRRADAALRPAARHRAGQVRPRLPVHAPAGRRREARFHAQGTAAGVRDEADRPLAPRAAPARQDCRAGVRANGVGARKSTSGSTATGQRSWRRTVRCRRSSPAPSTMSSLRHTSRARCRTSNNRHAGTWRHTAAIWCPPAICWLTARGGESAPTRRPACSPAAHRQRSRRP